MGEFAKVADGGSVRKAEDFFGSLLPHLFFLDSDPFRVIEREDEVASRTKRLLPHADQDLLAAVMKLKPSTVRPITVVGLLDGVSGSALVARGEALADIFVNRVTGLRRQFADEAGFRESVRTAAKFGEVPWATRFIHRELIARLLVDPSKNVTQNDAFDWYHTVVPLAYSRVLYHEELEERAPRSNSVRGS